MNQPNRLESEIIKGVKSAQKDYENMTDGWWLSHGPESFLMAMVANQIFKKGDFWVFPEASPKKIEQEMEEKRKRGRPTRVQTKRFDIVHTTKHYLSPVFFTEFVRYQTETNSQPCIHISEPGYEILHHKESKSGGLLHK